MCSEPLLETTPLIGTLCMISRVTGSEESTVSLYASKQTNKMETEQTNKQG